MHTYSVISVTSIYMHRKKLIRIYACTKILTLCCIHVNDFFLLCPFISQNFLQGPYIFLSSFKCPKWKILECFHINIQLFLDELLPVRSLGSAFWCFVPLRCSQPTRGRDTSVVDDTISLRLSLNY